MGSTTSSSAVGARLATAHRWPPGTSTSSQQPQPATSGAWSDALRELDARVRNGDEAPLPFAHDVTSLAGSTFWNLTTRFGDLDISFRPSGTQGYDDLRRDAVEVTLRGIPVLLASLQDIVRSKEAAGRDKDRRALPILRERVAQQLRAKRAQ